MQSTAIELFVLAMDGSKNNLTKVDKIERLDKYIKINPEEKCS
jgi:hypothetical protein